MKPAQKPAQTKADSNGQWHHSDETKALISRKMRESWARRREVECTLTAAMPKSTGKSS